MSAARPQLVTTVDATIKDEQKIVRNRQFDMQRSDVNTLLNYLHLTKATGQLVIHLSQGGIQTVTLVEQHVIFAEST